MFFILNLKKNLKLTPEYLGKRINKHLANLLNNAVEGSFDTKFGYIVKVLKHEKIGEGKVQDTSGDVLFPLLYKALVFMPYKGEVVDAIVHQVMEVGFTATLGPMSMFVASQNIAADYYLEPEARPHPRWVNKSEPSKVIQVGGDVRLRIMSVRVNGNEMMGVCEMSESYLGPISI